MFNTPRAPARSRRTRETSSRASLFPGETPARTPRPPRTIATRDSPDSLTISVGAPAASSTAAEFRALWSRDERHSVIASGALPPEVARVVENADFILHTVAGQLDPASGYALVSAPDACYAWNYAKRSSNPTVSVFPAPQPTHSHLATVPPALAAFYGTTEPGLLLVSATGEVRFWESMGLALHNVQRFQSVQLDLGRDRDMAFAERLWKIDSTNFVLTTTASTAFRLSIVHEGGRLVPRATPFTRSAGMSFFSRASPTIFNDSAERTGIVAAAAAQNGCYLLGRSTLQKWDMGPDGSVRLGWEIDLRESIGSLVLNNDGAWAAGNMLLMFNDLVTVSPKKFAVLVSYHRQDGASDASGRGKQAQHAIIVFENPDAHNISMDNCVYLSYLAHSDPRMLDVPRLYVPHGSHTAFVRFSDAILMASLSSAHYEDVITLKDSGRNAFIGVASSPPGFAASSVVAMAAIGGVMTVEVHEGVASARKMTSAASATARLKSKIEQAVFFGANHENPLTFDLPSGFQGDLPAALEAVSAEIVSSTAAFMTPVSETRQSLAERLSHLRELMLFVRHNGVLSLLPQSTRRHLCAHAEKVKAALDLWDYQNRLMDKLQTRSPQSLFADSIRMLMDQLSDHEDDFVRAFFRRHVLELDGLLDAVYRTFHAAVSSLPSGADASGWVLEANRVFTIALRASTTWRTAEAHLYEVNREHPSVDLWMASETLLGDMEKLFGLTQKVIQDRTRRIGTIVDEAPPGPNILPTELGTQQKEQAELKEQMTTLAEGLCENAADKLRVAETRQATTMGEAEKQDVLVLQQRWDALKPATIRPLVEIDRVDEAYALAEHYRDFPTLVYLCETGDARGVVRVQGYIERFGNAFAFELYQWYIDRGEYYELLDQDEVYGARLTEFFKAHPHPQLSWMHDIASKRYHAAAAALRIVNVDTANLDQKQLVASIAKLAAVADSKSHFAHHVQLVSNMDEDLDNIESQRGLAADVRALAKSGKAFVAAHATNLGDKDAFRALLTADIDRLLAGDALDIESLVDALTLKDAGDRPGDAALAITRLYHETTLPEARKQVSLLSAWRRVYIRDDWEALSQTAGRSEEDLRDAQRKTWAYATFRGLHDEDIDPAFIVPPINAPMAPTDDELKARFPAYSAGDIAALMGDTDAEIRAILAVIEDGYVKQIAAVRELAASDARDGFSAGSEDAGDVVMQ